MISYYFKKHGYIHHSFVFLQHILIIIIMLAYVAWMNMLFMLVDHMEDALFYSNHLVLRYILYIWVIQRGIVESNGNWIILTSLFIYSLFTCFVMIILQCITMILVMCCQLFLLTVYNIMLNTVSLEVILIQI